MKQGQIATHMEGATIILSKDEGYKAFIENGIQAYNNEKNSSDVFRYYRDNAYTAPFGFYAFLDGEIVGGIIASKKMQWLAIDILFVAEKFRKHRLGSQLMREAITYCARENLIGIHLCTLDFQAKAFYEKVGFELIAEIKDWPAGVTRFEFIKYINR